MDRLRDYREKNMKIKPQEIHSKKMDGYLLRPGKEERKRIEDTKDIDINIGEEVEWSLSKGKKIPNRY